MSDTANTFAPYPLDEDQVTADGLARHMAVGAQQAWTRWRAATRITDDQGQQIRELLLLVAIDQWGVTNLLRAVQQHAPEQANEIAKDLWTGWEDGGAVGESLWEWLTEYGIDPEAIAATASKENDR